MKLIRDDISLERSFPFRISRITLNRENSGLEYYHWHSYFEITLVEEGQGRYFVNGRKYDMKEDDIIIFNNVEPHGWNLLEKDMHLLVAVFSPEFVADKMSLFDMEYLRPFVERGSNFKNRIGREEALSVGIRDGLREIYREWQERREGFRLMIKANVLRILTILIRACQDESKPGEMLREKKDAMKRLEQAIAYVEGNYCRRLTLEEAAAAAYMSPNYFSTCFRRVMNVSFSEYVTKLRIARAKELLRTTDKSVVEIAMECGFRNLSNFYRLYKKYTGGTPRRD